MEPSDAQSHYSEELILLPGLGTRYLQPSLPAIKSATALGLPLGARVLIAQSPFKLLPNNDARMVALAHAAPTAQFVLFDTPYGGVNDAIKLRLETTFDAHDLNPNRLHWQPTTDRARFLQIAEACDVALDSLGFSGGNTTLDALITGLPLVTSPGEFMRGRQSMAMLQALALDHCVAEADSITAAAANFLLHRDARKPYRDIINECLHDYLQDAAPLTALVMAVSEICGG
jgi:predicted O-linked N-acetylglucosamine transferase (SPINDLY family)